MDRYKICCIIGFFFIACGGSRVSKTTEPSPESGAIIGLENLDENFDPSKLKEPPIPIIAKSSDKQKNADADRAGALAAVELSKEIIGYRIQILQTEDAQEAREFQQDAFLRLDIDAYVSYDNPYYKVRVGDFTSRFEAEEFLATLEGRGFKSAWIVRTLIVNPAYKAKDEQKEMR